MTIFTLIDLGRGEKFNIVLFRNANKFGRDKIKAEDVLPELCELIVCDEKVDVVNVVVRIFFFL